MRRKMACLDQERKFSLKRSQVTVNLLPHQICVDNMWRIFHLVSWLLVCWVTAMLYIPSWWMLRSECDDVIYFPIGTFDVRKDIYGTLIVEEPFRDGEPMSSRNLSTGRTVNSSSGTAASKRWRIEEDECHQEILDKTEDLKSTTQEMTCKLSSLISVIHAYYLHQE